MSRIGIGTFGADGGKSGISRYVIQLLRAFAADAGGDQLEVLLYESERELMLPAEHDFDVIGIGERWRSPLRNIAWHQLALPRLCRQRGYDALLLTAGNRRLVWRPPCPTIGVVHDLSSLHVKGKYDRARTFYIHSVLPRMIRKLTRVITISESSKRDIVGHARVPEEHVSVIPLGADERFRPRPRAEAQAALDPAIGARPPYVVYVSRIEHPGKNHATLLRAWDQLKREADLPHQLLLAGGDWTRSEEVHAVHAGLEHREDVHFAGFVPDSAIPDLYAGAEMLVFPSLYEGFGLPILEAMSCGVPVACSNVSSMPEVAGEAAELFDPHSAEAICAAMRAVLEDPQRAEQLGRDGLARSEQFSWTTAAARTLEVVREAIEAGR